MTSENFKDFVLEQLCAALDECYELSVKKIFGEYCLYVRDEAKKDPPKPIFLLCDECLLIKQHKILQELCKDIPLGTPYPNAKEHFMLDPQDHALLKELVELVMPILPTSKKRKKSVINSHFLGVRDL